MKTLIKILCLSVLWFSCEEPEPEVYGCTEPSSCSYDPEVTVYVPSSCLYIDHCGVCDGGNADQDCAGVCFGNSALDDCGVCDNDTSNDCEQDGFLIYYEANVPIAGFQFNVDGVEVISTSGGAVEVADFTVSTSSSVVLGFSLIGSTIPAGNGLLVQLEVSGDLNNACLSTPVFSDSSGNNISVFIMNCNTLVVGSTVADFSR